MSRTSNSPSFSSSLLDKVFRSIDESNEPTYSRIGATNTHTARPTSSDRRSSHQSTSEMKTNKIRPIRRKIDADKKPDRNRNNDFRLIPNHEGPVSTSRDHAERKNNPNDMIGFMNLKPIRTSTARTDQHPDSSSKKNREAYKHDSSKPTDETSSAKIRVQKMYGDLKDVKQPISPGGRLTRFITSLFTKRNSSNKVEKVRETEAIRTRRVPVTTCSSATSYYRSCLSNKPTTASKNSVRFCPVNIVIDSECRENPRLVSSRRRCEIDGIKQSRAQHNLKEIFNKFNRNGVLSIYDGELKLSEEDSRGGDNDNDNDNDDGGSCTSSDLFELDHIGGTVNHSIDNELPVYETTKFHSKNPVICEHKEEWIGPAAALLQR